MRGWRKRVTESVPSGSVSSPLALEHLPSALLLLTIAKLLCPDTWGQASWTQLPETMSQRNPPSLVSVEYFIAVTRKVLHTAVGRDPTPQLHTTHPSRVNMDVSLQRHPLFRHLGLCVCIYTSVELWLFWAEFLVFKALGGTLLLRQLVECCSICTRHIFFSA